MREKSSGRRSTHRRPPMPRFEGILAMPRKPKLFFYARRMSSASATAPSPRFPEFSVDDSIVHSISESAMGAPEKTPCALIRNYPGAAPKASTFSRRKTDQRQKNPTNALASHTFRARIEHLARGETPTNSPPSSPHQVIVCNIIEDAGCKKRRHSQRSPDQRRIRCPINKYE